jgi:hypothetical protein
MDRRRRDGAEPGTQPGLSNLILHSLHHNLASDGHIQRDEPIMLEVTNVKRLSRAVIVGICLGPVLYYSWLCYQGLRRIRTLHITNANLDYSDRSADELVSQHLIDLNSAGTEQIAALGVSAEALERLSENRPYRSKLELVSRMILSQEEYALIKDRVAVAEAREPVKIA